MRRPALTAAAAVLAATATVGCSALERAIGCANTAVTVAGIVGDLQTATESATEDPAAALDALDRIDGSLNELGDTGADTDVNQAVENLRTSVDEVRGAVENGQTPDVGAVGAAADELTAVCTEG